MYYLYITGWAIFIELGRLLWHIVRSVLRGFFRNHCHYVGIRFVFLLILLYIYIFFVFRINCYFYLHLKIKAFYYIFTNRYRKFLKRRGIHAGQENRQLLENLLVSCHTFDFVIYFLLYICYSTTIDLRRKRISDFSPCGWHSRILLGNFSNTFLDDREIVKKQKFAIVKGM